MSIKEQFLNDVSRIMIDHFNTDGRFKEYESLVEKYDDKIVREALIRVTTPEPDSHLLWEALMEEDENELNDQYIIDDEPSEAVLEAYKENNQVIGVYEFDEE